VLNRRLFPEIFIPNVALNNILALMKLTPVDAPGRHGSDSARYPEFDEVVVPESHVTFGNT
jgi:hypothetical protein